MPAKELLSELPLPTLDQDPTVIYALDRGLRIAYCNPAWDRFAAENGGAGLDRAAQIGRSVLDVTPEPLAPFYLNLFAEARAAQRALTHLYECSSAGVYRNFRMQLMPLARSGGILVVNALVVEELHGREAHAPAPSRYTNEAGLIVMCAHCRRTRRCLEEAWDWVPAHVERPGRNISHGLCSICFEYHYGSNAFAIGSAAP